MEDDTKLRYHANHFTQFLSKMVPIEDVLTARDAYNVYLEEMQFIRNRDGRFGFFAKTCKKDPGGVSATHLAPAL